jgi:hypothetical protein
MSLGLRPRSTLSFSTSNGQLFIKTAPLQSVLIIDLLSVLIAIAMLLLCGEPECSKISAALAACRLQHSLSRSYRMEECTSHG